MRDKDRRYDEACGERARRELREYVSRFDSQQEAAEALGVHQGTISRGLKPNGQPSLKVLIPLARKTGHTLDEILGLKGSKSGEYRLSDSEVQRVAKVAAEQAVDRVTKHLRGSEPPTPPPHSPKKR